MSDVYNPQSPRIVLILGGARSGKSSFAERLAANSGRRVVFIATATAGDDEMRDRIARHRASRPTDWQTIEEPLDLVGAIQRVNGSDYVLLLDCITLWLGNLIGKMGREDEETIALQETLTHTALAEIERLLMAVEKLAEGNMLIIVSNEVGLGIVPAYELGRVYRDTLGIVNQRLAQAASRVYYMVAGLAIDIKRLHEEMTL